MGDIINEKLFHHSLFGIIPLVFFCTFQYWLDPLKSVYKQLKGKTAWLTSLSHRKICSCRPHFSCVD